MLLLRLLVYDLGRSSGRGRNGLPALDQRHDLIRLAAQVAVGAERVVPTTFRAAKKKQA